MRIDVEEKVKAVIISITGEVSLSGIEEFEQIFNKYNNPDFNVIALDLKDVSYIDSFGISRIIRISRVVSVSGIDFVLINMNEDIHQIFKMTAFNDFFKILTMDQFKNKYLQQDQPDDK